MDITEIVLLIGINALAFFWQPKDNDVVYLGAKIVIYIISAIITIVIGGLWMDTYYLVSLMIVGLGTFQLVLAAVETARIGGPSRGISQFKGIYRQISGKFHR